MTERVLFIKLIKVLFAAHWLCYDVYEHVRRFNYPIRGLSDRACKMWDLPEESRSELVNLLAHLSCPPEAQHSVQEFVTSHFADVERRAGYFWREQNAFSSEVVLTPPRSFRQPSPTSWCLMPYNVYQAWSLDCVYIQGLTPFRRPLFSC